MQTYLYSPKKYPCFTLFFSVFVIYAVTIGCTQDTEDETVYEVPSNDTLTSSYNPLRFTISYPNKELEDWLNRKFDKVIADTYVSRKEDKDSVRLIITKPHKLNLSTSGDSVNVAFPLEVEVIADRIKKSGKVKHRRISGALTLYLSIKPDVDQDWNIITSTRIKNYEWNQKPKLELQLSKFGIAFIIDRILAGELDKLAESLDVALKEKVDLKKGINKTWENIQKPIKIAQNNTPPIYFKIDPKNISGDIQVTPAGFLFDLTVETRAAINTDSSLSTKPKPLPPFKTLKAIPADSNKLELLANIPLQTINQSLNQVAKNYSYNNLVLDFFIKDIKVSGSSEKIALDVEIDGTTKSEIKLTGKPFYDKESYKLSVIDLNYSVETNEKEISLLSSGLKADLLKYLSSKVVLDLAPYIEHLPDYLNETINQGKSSEKFLLNFEEIKLEKILFLVNESELQILLKCKPKFDISLKKLPVKKKIKIS